MMDIGLAETTYLYGYKGERPLKPRLAYKTLPCMYPPGSAHPCRESVRRELRHIPMKKPKPRPPQVVVTPVARPVTPQCKNVTFGNATKVFETKFGPMDMLTVNRLHQKMFYSTRATRAMEECAIPIIEPPTAHRTMREPKPDMVVLKSKRYEATPEDWQAAPLWDRIQTRFGTVQSSSADDNNLAAKRQTSQGVHRVHTDRIGDVPKAYGTSDKFVRPLPGYAGFNYRDPVEAKRCDKTWANNVMSDMKKSFRTMPDHCHSSKDFARKESFSNTVTLTTPFVPYNLIGYDVTPVTLESRFANCLINNQHTAEPVTN